MSQAANDIAEECGYNSAVDLIMDLSTQEELNDILRELLSEDECLYDYTLELAHSHLDYVQPPDPDEGRESYHEWRDRLMDEALDRIDEAKGD
jgi:hypothetical protein